MATFRAYTTNTSTTNDYISFTWPYASAPSKPEYDLDKFRKCLAQECKDKTCVLCEMIGENLKKLKALPRFMCKKCKVRYPEAKCKNYVCFKCKGNNHE